MAIFSAKQLLDELMGRDRDLGLEEKKNDFSWDGPDICKHFLVNFCPNDLFVNTKADLGVCPKIHDERLKKEYEKSSRYEKMGYEEDFLRFCQSMLSDVDKRIRRARQRLALSNKESTLSQTSTKNNEEKVNVITERINGLLQTVEKLGCEGKVEEAQGIMKLCEQLKDERETLRKNSETNHWFQTAEIAAAQEKQMEVCEVCGAFLIVGDAQQRVDDHLMGKQHVGYAKLKEAVQEIVDVREKERSEKDKIREKEREERRKQLSKDDEIRREQRRKHIEEERRRRSDYDRHHRDLDRHHRDPDRHYRDPDRHNRDFDRHHRDPDRHHRDSRRLSRERNHRDSMRRSHSKESHSHSKSRDKERSHRRSRSIEDKDRLRSLSRDGKRLSKRSRSRSSEHRSHKEKHRDSRKLDENGESPERISRSEESSKGRHSSGD